MDYPVCVLNVFQKLSGSHKALVEMQDDVAELLRSAIREYPQTKVGASAVRHMKQTMGAIPSI